jgi:hypothetical protein
MTYSPINVDAYTNAYSGAIAGMAVSGWITDPNAADYAKVSAIAGAFAEAFDTVWNDATALNWLQIQSIQSVAQEQFAGHAPGSLDNASFVQAANWAVPAAACAALVLEGSAYVASQGITPNTPGSGGGDFAPTQNVRFYDASFSGTPNGSIAKPWTTFAAFNAEVLAAGGGSNWQLSLPAAGNISVDENIPDVGARIAYQGVSQLSTYLEDFHVVNQSGFPLYTFRDLSLQQLTLDGGNIQIEAYDSSVCFSTGGGTVQGSCKLYNCGVTNDCDVGDQTLYANGSRFTDGLNVKFSTGRFEDCFFDDGTNIFPQAGITSFIATKFGTGCTISNSQTPTIELDPYSAYWFATNAVTYGGTIVYTPGGSAVPIQNVLYLDPAATPASPNGSIVSPFQTWDPQVLTKLQASGPSGSWTIMLPPSALALGTQTQSLQGIGTLVFQGIDRTVSSIGNFRPVTDNPAPHYVYRDLAVTTLQYDAGSWGNQYLENVDCTTLNLIAGGGWGIFDCLNCTFGTINAGSVTATFRLVNCTITGAITSTGQNTYDTCVFGTGHNLTLDSSGKFYNCTFGANNFIQGAGTQSLDRASEFSFFSQGGQLSGAVINSLDGDGPAFQLPNSNAPNLDFTAQTRAILPKAGITGNIVKQIVVTGGVANQQFVIDSYNTTGFTYTIQFAAATIATIGVGNFRYIFAINAAGTAVVLQSVRKLQ